MTERPSVLAVSAVFPPAFAGTGTVAYHNAAELAARGFRVAVVTPWTPGSHPDPPGVEVHRLRPRFRMGNAARLTGLSIAGRSDIVHLHAPFIFGGEQAVRFARDLGAGLVLTYHQDLLQTGVRGLAFRAYSRTTLRSQIRSADAVIVPTVDYARASKLSDALLAHPRLVEIPNGTDPEHFRPGPAIPPQGFPWDPSALGSTFLFVGALDEAHFFKGLDVLLRALRRCSHDDARLVVVGDGAARRRFEAEARRLGVAHRVWFAGRVAPEDLPSFYRAAACTVLPSTTRGEIFGIVLIEAMACGRPTIASRLPGVRTVVDDGVTGLLVEPGDERDLARALDKVLEGSQDNWGAAGRRKVEATYGWDRIGDRLASLFREVAA